MMISRMAPTPSGFLHMGNILNFVMTWERVRRNSGRLLLRIDDCDSGRVRPEYLDDIFETLEWLEIDFDQGPRGPDDFNKLFSQKHRREQYTKTRDSIANSFNCHCSRAEIAKLSPSGIYPGTCRSNKIQFVPGETSTRLLSHRLKLGDIVIWRKDDLPAYHLVSVCDDSKDGVNFILRGFDLEPSSEAQIQLAQFANLNSFNTIKIEHHPLITHPDGKKLSKSDQSVSIKQLRSNGATPASVFREIATHLKRPPAEKITDFLL